MARKNFFELLEREIDFQEDYEKIEDAIINEKYMLSLENVIEKISVTGRSVEILFLSGN